MKKGNSHFYVIYFHDHFHYWFHPHLILTDKKWSFAFGHVFQPIWWWENSYIIIKKNISTIFVTIKKLMPQRINNHRESLGKQLHLLLHQTNHTLGKSWITLWVEKRNQLDLTHFKKRYFFHISQRIIHF